MHPIRHQRTIASPATVRGVGYWSGEEVRVEFLPAEIDRGICFIRTDLPGQPRIAAAIENRMETPLRTTLRSDGVAVEMIEHIMAALAGLQIDNCRVLVDRPEMPGCDGSSRPFVEALTLAGIVEQTARRERVVVRKVIRLEHGQSWIEARPSASDDTILHYELDYGQDSAIGRQSKEIVLSPVRFQRELAPSRTFLLQSEAEALRARGLGKTATFRDLLVFGPDGPIDNRLRFPDECVRHKLLDMVGDLALAGRDVVGRVVAHRSGHRLNAQLVRAVLDQDENRQQFRRCA